MALPNFRFQYQAAHLTYKNHLPLEELLEHIKSKLGDLIWYSLVHEHGHNDGEIDYEHTHVAFRAKKKPNIRDARTLDFNGVHPHIKGLSGKIQEANTWKYHEKEPISTLRSALGPGGIGGRGNEALIKNATSLYEACEALGIGIKNVADVAAIRSDKSKRTQYVHKYEDAEWSLPIREDFKCLFLYGPTGTGKTQWALHHFRNPFLCSHIDDLRDFNADRNDGIVFDDMSFRHMPREGVIHLLDWDEDRSIHCRFYCAQIPAGTKKIFTSNKTFHETFPDDDHGAIRRRISEIIRIEGPTFTGRTVPQVPEPEEAPLTQGMESDWDIEDWEQAIEALEPGLFD